MPTGALTGSLEDLGLGEILQILSLSRKSGVLHLAREGGEGLSLFIRDGQVIVVRPQPVVQPLLLSLDRLGFRTDEKGKLFSLLKEKRFQSEPWLRFFTRELGMDKNRARECALRYMIFLVGQVLTWDGGSFEFVLLDPAHEEFRKAFSFPLFPSLEEGVNGQYLAMEALRIQDERSQSAPPPSVGIPDSPRVIGASSLPLPAPATREQTVKQVLLVDDQEEVIEATGNYLRQKGYRVAVAQAVDIALEIIQRSEETGWVVLADLVMPKRDRSGLLGGLEVAELLRNHPKVSRIFLGADSIYPNLEERARLLGVEGIVLKPPRKEWIQNLKSSAVTYGERIIGVVGPPHPEELPSPSPSDSLDLEIGIEELDPENPLKALFSQENLIPLPKPRTSQGFVLLRQMVEELLTPEGETEVSLLILRFASQLFQRVILFVVTERELRGLGQVGLTGDGVGRLVRELRIPLGKGTIFDQVVQERRLFAGKPPAQPLLHRMVTRLGGPIPFEIVLAPIAVQGRVVALLYADQVPTQAPLRDLEVLEVFLAQAGLALERAYLRRQLLRKDQEGKP